MSGEWSVVGYDSHPIPGDPSQVALMSRYYADVASAINLTAANLKQVTDATEFESDAVAAFRELALKVASSVNEIDDRYSVVSSALGTYGGELSRVRQGAWGELGGAQQHHADLVTAQRRVAHLEDQILDPNTPPANLPYLHTQLNQKHSDVYSATAGINAAIARIQQLVVERAAAAQAAAALIEDECRGSDLNDGTWDKVADFASDLWNGLLDALEGLVALIDDILPILEILSFIVAVVMIVLICLGIGVVILAIAALVIAATSLLLTEIKLGAQVVLASGGRVSWSEVGKTAVDVGFAALDVVLAATGLSEIKAVTGGIKAAALHPIRDAFVDYVVKDRGVDFIHNEIDYILDVASGEDPPTAGDVVMDLLFTGREETAAAAFVDGLQWGTDLAMDGIGEAYEWGQDVVETIDAVVKSPLSGVHLGDLCTAGV